MHVQVKKKPGNPKWGGTQMESKLIKKYADEWCRNNGYPIKKRKHVNENKTKY
jgi:hypothetical protein